MIPTIAQKKGQKGMILKLAELRAAIDTALGNQAFDTSTVVSKAMSDTQLAAALEAAVPNCRLKSGRFRHRPVHRAMVKLDREECFLIDRYGWWYLYRGSYPPGQYEPASWNARRRREARAQKRGVGGVTFKHSVYA